ncbi:uncharacterized protein LOC141904605 [Tubulanus polymorphus]|uniref:uncharacterized protein LOC141904605 n=1 Tax=Tubulanus polymorphus TaxID=672921 RepID=UPI003DA51999
MASNEVKMSRAEIRRRKILENSEIRMQKLLGISEVKARSSTDSAITDTTTTEVPKTENNEPKHETQHLDDDISQPEPIVVSASSSKSSLNSPPSLQPESNELLQNSIIETVEETNSEETVATASKHHTEPTIFIETQTLLFIIAGIFVQFTFNAAAVIFLRSVVVPFILLQVTIISHNFIQGNFESHRGHSGDMLIGLLRLAGVKADIVDTYVKVTSVVNQCFIDFAVYLFTIVCMRAVLNLVT